MFCRLKASSPACTELESLVMDWLGKMIGLPTEFLHSQSDSLGGGVIQVHLSSILMLTDMQAVPRNCFDSRNLCILIGK